jgi:hypothetical protein
MGNVGAEIDAGGRAMRSLPTLRPSRSILLKVMFVLTSVMTGASNTRAEENTPPLTDTSVSMPLTEHYANKNYVYTCHPTLESQKHLKLTSFGGEADISGQQKEIPPDNLTITLQDPPSTWYCTQNPPIQK